MVSLELDGSPVSSIEFKDVFFGQSGRKNCVFSNNSTLPRTFIFYSANPIFTVIPSEGTLEPKQTIEVVFLFRPQKGTELQESFNSSILLRIIETRSEHNYNLFGNATSITVLVSPKDFDFGRQIVKTKQSKDIQFINKCDQSMSFSLQKSAEFTFEPPCGQIPPNSSIKVKVIFFPKELGEFHLESKIVFSNDSQKI